MMEDSSKVDKMLFRLQGHYIYFNKEDIHYSKPHIRISGGTCMCSKYRVVVVLYKVKTTTRWMKDKVSG